MKLKDQYLIKIFLGSLAIANKWFANIFTNPGLV